MAKYPISKEFFPFNLFAPPMSKKFVLMAQKHMKTPGLLWKDPELDVQTRTIHGYQGGEIELYMMTACCTPSSCGATAFWSNSTKPKVPCTGLTPPYSMRLPLRRC